MPRAACFLLAMTIVPACQPAERVDNVLAQLIPPDSTSLFGARMEEVKATPLFQKLAAQQKLPQLDDFARETGFDPRRDVRDMLVASTSRAKSGVLLARGSFHITPEAFAKLKEAHKVEYRGYTIYGSPDGESGFCILDGTLAIAGPMASLRAALDQYRHPNRAATAALLAKAQAVPMQFQVWAVSLGGADFIANNLPNDPNAMNFAKIFSSLQNTYFMADLSRGFHASAHGECASEADAKSLGDAARGLIGFGRLSVPDKQPELLRLWDGIQVEQQQRSITITANIQQELIDKLVQLFEASPSMPSMPRKPPIPRRPAGSSEGESHPQESRSRPH